MPDPAIQLRPARPEDAQAWVQLGYPPAYLPAPEVLAKEIAAFNAPPSDATEARYIAWLNNQAVARMSFGQLDNVVELRELNIAAGCVTEYGTSIVEAAAQVARSRGDILTIDFYPPLYSRSFLGAGFRQNTRTRMVKSLAGYTPRSVILPEGVTLRNPIAADEAAVAELAYNNYMGTSDGDMVSSSHAQAAAIIRAMFHNDYNLLIPGGSYLATDTAGNLVGDVILGDSSNTPDQPLAWIMDVSLSPAYRGQGLGKALLYSAINAAHALNYPRIGLIVTIGNSIAQSLYSATGFEPHGELMYEAVLRF